MANRTEEQLKNIDTDSKKACTTSIFKCIHRRCPSLYFCYPDLEVND